MVVSAPLSTESQHRQTSICPLILITPWNTRELWLLHSSIGQKKICSFHLDRVKEEEHVTQALRQNGYPLKMIERISKKMSTNSARNSIMEDRQPVATVVLPYIRNVSESIRRILTPLNIRTCFRPHKTLRQLLVHPKTPIQINQRNGVV